MELVLSNFFVNKDEQVSHLLLKFYLLILL